MADIRFVGPEYDGAEKELRELAGKITTITDDMAVNKFGETALKNPTDIEISPVLTVDEPVLVINAWHGTGSSEDPGRFQVHDFILKTRLEGENVYLETEDGRLYPVSTRETLLLIGLADIAIINTLLHTRDSEQ